MQKIKSILIACLLASAGMGQAEDLTDRVGFGGSVGTSVLVGSTDLRRGTDGDVNWGFWARTGLAPHWGLGFSYDRVPFRRSDLRLQPMMVNMFYQIAPDSKYNPNIHAGAGLVNVSPVEEKGLWGVNAGLGIDRFISEKWSVGLSADYRWANTKASSINHDAHTVSLSLKIGFWPKPAQREQQPAVVVVEKKAEPVLAEETKTEVQPSVEAAPEQATQPLVTCYYEFNKHQVSQAIKNCLDEKLGVVSEYKWMFVSGHADKLGSDAINEYVANMRAKNIASELEKRGFSNLVYQGFSNKKPVASNDTKEGRALNRRVEIEIIK